MCTTVVSGHPGGEVYLKEYLYCAIHLKRCDHIIGSISADLQRKSVPPITSTTYDTQQARASHLFCNRFIAVVRVLQVSDVIRVHTCTLPVSL